MLKFANARFLIKKICMQDSAKNKAKKNAKREKVCRKCVDTGSFFKYFSGCADMNIIPFDFSEGNDDADDFYGFSPDSMTGSDFDLIPAERDLLLSSIQFSMKSTLLTINTLTDLIIRIAERGYEVDAELLESIYKMNDDSEYLLEEWDNEDE